MRPSPRPRHWPGFSGHSAIQTELPRGLYAIADAHVGDPFAHGRSFIEAGCKLIQVRAKGWHSGPLVELTARLVAVAHDWDALVIVNDHPQVALDAGAHGVHLGQSDMDVCAARDLLGPDAIVGLSTHDLAQVLQSSQADYIGYGPIFATSSKVDALNPRGVRSLQEAVLATPCPVYAIGGIDASNLANVRHTKCHGWAVISDLHRHASIQEGVARLSGD